MKYTSISLYRKMLEVAYLEGMMPEDFKGLLIPPSAMQDLQAVPADQFFALHEMMDELRGPGFSEQSAFSHAFKRWTGSSPLDYRQTKA